LGEILVETTSAKPRSEKATKVRALLAGGLVLGIGAAFTLAAWTDNEWVFGQSENGGGPGTKFYQMEQNTWSAPSGGVEWGHKPEAPGGALTFSVNADNLVPGTTVYAPMQLRASDKSQSLVATLTGAARLDQADSAANSAALYGALRYQLKQGVDKDLCNATNFGSNGSDIVGVGSTLNSRSDTPISLPAGTTDAAAGTPVSLCFALTLPSSAPVDLQGLKTTPVWTFSSTVGLP
jgi:predicted ribosomally synthesized peptide with SipW-like signal peptide